MLSADELKGLSAEAFQEARINVVCSCGHDQYVHTSHGNSFIGKVTYPCSDCPCVTYVEDPQSRQDRNVWQAEWQRRSEEERKKREAEIDALGAVDMLGFKIAVGDHVAWPTSAGRAVGMSVGQITKINWKDKRSGISGRMYTVQAKPLKAAYTGHYYSSTKWNPLTKKHEARPDGIPPVTIQKVQNILKIDIKLQDELDIDV